MLLAQNDGVLRGSPDAVSSGHGVRDDRLRALAAAAGVPRRRVRQRQPRLHDVLYRQPAGKCFSTVSQSVVYF